jgi:nucleoside-diphosphate-sugar epimerase
VNLKNNKVFVTDSDGFIGSHLVERLLREDCQVKAFAYYNSFNSLGWIDTFPKDKLRDIEIFAGDVKDPKGV